MSEPVSETGYWAERLRQARRGHLHHAVFRCDAARWRRIEARHRLILKEVVRPEASILDAGCGYGRLPELLPDDWRGDYLGVDLSPDFVALARERHPGRRFEAADLRDLSSLGAARFDLAVLISIRPMVRRNLGDEEWDRMESELRRRCRRLLYLEYDEKCWGEFR